MIRKLSSGKFRLYSKKKDPKTGKRRNLGTHLFASGAVIAEDVLILNLRNDLLRKLVRQPDCRLTEKVPMDAGFSLAGGREAQHR